MTTTITIRLDEQIKNQLQKLAEATDRSSSFLASEAISNYVNMHSWQIDAIKTGIAEADAGQLINHEKIVKQWKEKHASLLDKKRKQRSCSH